MKMSKELFEMLKSDCETLLECLKFTADEIDNTGDAWAVFGKVCFQRNMSDNHPHFKNGGMRFLPFDQEAEDDPRINGGPYLGRFYELEDLDDTHIKTALKRIMPNAGL